MTKGSRKNLWDLAIDQAESQVADGDKSEDSAILVVGSKSSGKTTMILRFLDRDESAKPTVALEYTFGRTAKGHNIAKDVGHIWELGGGTWLTKLMEIPLSADTLLTTTLVLVLDLSRPDELWFTLETLIKAANSRLETLIQEIKPTNREIRDTLKTRSWQRVGEDHPDKSMLNPLLIPFVIIGGKYDIFQDFDSEKRKVICRTLRFVAHTYGATLQPMIKHLACLPRRMRSLMQVPAIAWQCGIRASTQFFSSKQEQLVTRSRAVLSHYLFNTAASKSLQTEHNKPLVIPAGHDSIQTIGSPPVAERDIGKLSARSPLDLWKQAYTSHFPQQNVNIPVLLDDPAKDPQYAEPAIDALRAQKDEELERYRRLCDRRTKEAARQETY